jgi:formamidopyrimidine-DNA glycosylase
MGVVYDREGESLSQLRIVRSRRIVQGGRSTYFCRKCQR